MSRKSKGINAERELVHLFWKHGWAAVRVAGSGSSHYPSPDLVVGNKNRKLAIECKACKGDRQYLTKQEVDELVAYAQLFGAEPWIAVRFNTLDWSFHMIDDLTKTENSYGVSRESARKKGLSFAELIQN